MRIGPVAAALLVAIAPACGRFEFDAIAVAIDGNDDAPDGATPSSLTHQYSFNNSYVDDLGGPDLVAQGGMLVSSGGYQFAVNQGLQLLNGTAVGVYSIEVTFNFTKVAGYNKVLDFKALGSDAGLYIYDTQLQFVVVPTPGCPGNDCYTSPMGLFAAGTQTAITLTRDATGAVAAYVNATPQIAFVDGAQVGAFDSSANIINFFTDDNVTSNEASAGVVQRIRIYDTALTASQVGQ